MSRRTFLVGGAAAAAGGAGVLLAACTGSNRITSSATQHDHSPTSGSAASTSSGGTSATAGEPPSSDWTGGDLNAGLDVTTSSARLPPHFQVALPIPAVLTPVAVGDTDHYRITQTPATVGILPGYRTPIWSYNGTFPGPTLVSRTGRRAVVTHTNRLPIPTVTHLHGAATPAGQDGYTTDLLLPAGMAAPTAFPAMPGMTMKDPHALFTHVTRDYTYPMRQPAATLWYHDHRMAFTGATVNRGLAGFHLIHDDTEDALRLPTGTRDLPLMICDRAFNADGSLRYPASDPTAMTTPGVNGSAFQGFLGDVTLVNGAPWPEHRVETAKYRLRILNASNARSYRLELRGPRGTVPFTQIGTDRGLLTAPLRLHQIVIAPAQRFDVIVDLTGLAVGDAVTLVDQADPSTSADVLRFVVTRRVHDTTVIPDRLTTARAVTAAASAKRRTMNFQFDGAIWTINGHAFDPATFQATVTAGSTEIWTIRSDYHHPVHIHAATMTIATRDGDNPSLGRTNDLRQFLSTERICSCRSSAASSARSSGLRLCKW